MEFVEFIKSLFSNNLFLAIATIIGTLLTALGTGVTIWQAKKVKKYREQIAFDLRKIRISEISEHLKRAQDEGRKLLTQVQQLNRGKSEIAITEIIQGHIDNSLNLLPLSGADDDIRQKINNIQTKLRNFQNARPDDKSECASDMHSHIQESVSLCKERVGNLELGEGNE
ncbi:MAG: hypothetical protein RPU42_05490 [Candidatus Sedimenticola sp. (ex Thyasira tokunagai)]